jgi:YD repeat-containing protein
MGCCNLAPAIYSHETYRIFETATGYRWTDKRGNWQEYDSKGRLLSFGNLAGVVGRLVYEQGENGRVTGIADRDGTQVIWFEYDAVGDLVAASDQYGRRVEYTYTGGRLERIKDALGQETINEYDARGRIIKTVDSRGRPTFVTYDTYGNVASVLDRNGVGHFFEFDYDEAKKEFYARLTTSSGMIKGMRYDKDGHTSRVDVNGRTMQEILETHGVPLTSLSERISELPGNEKGFLGQVAVEPKKILYGKPPHTRPNRKACDNMVMLISDWGCDAQDVFYGFSDIAGVPSFSYQSKLFPYRSRIRLRSRGQLD